MSRISRAQMFMQIARAAAMRSTCFRLNVGAVVVVNNRPVSLGYNGVPPGKPHCSGNDCPGKEYCQETVHAEKNALERVPLLLSTPWDIYSTHSPCIVCLNYMAGINAVERLFFESPYRETDHLDLFRDRFKVYQVTPAGYVVDWFTKDVVIE